MAAPITHETKNGKLAIDAPTFPRVATSVTYEHFATGATYSANYTPGDITGLHRIFIGMPELFDDYIRSSPQSIATVNGQAVARFEATSGTHPIDFELVMNKVWTEPTAETFTELRQKVRANESRLAALEANKGSPAVHTPCYAGVSSTAFLGYKSNVIARFSAYDAELKRRDAVIGTLEARIAALEARIAGFHREV